MNKKIKWAGMLAGACVFACGFGVYNAASVQASANETAVLWDGFAITATAVRTQDPVGLRFKTDVERLTPTMKKYNPDAEYYTVLTLTTGGKEYTTTRYADVWRPDGSGWNTVLLGIPESDYATEVTAQSFVKLNGRETAFYQTEKVTISIAQTAAAAMSYGATSEYITQYVDDIVTGVSLKQTSETIEVGQKLQLNAATTPSGYMAKWTSSDTSVATVDNKGSVKAKNVGTATITAEINGYTASCQITVTERDESITGFASQATVSSYNKMTIPGTWLNDIFADERIDAVAYTIHSNRATTLKAIAITNEISLSANTDTKATFTRSMYEAWQASGASDFEYKGSSILSATVTFSNFAKVWAIDESETLTKAEAEALEGLMPDYNDNSYQFDFSGYSSLTDGSWKEYDAETGETTKHQADEDFRNQYRIEEYKDAGMTVLLPQSACAVPKGYFRFTGSKLKEVMDMASQAGMQKVIVTDERLFALIADQTDGIIGDGKLFATQADLDEYIQILMAEYAAHPAFYGVMLNDEQPHGVFEAYGQVYKAIKRCYPDAYIHCNLYPPVGGDIIGEGKMFPTPSDELIAKYTAYGMDERHTTRFAAFEAYLKAFIAATGADAIMYDQYPLDDTGTYECYVGGMQVAANVCAEMGVKLRFVSQTMTMRQGAEDTNSRILTEEDLRYLNNMVLGFGGKQISYYTYFTYQASSEKAYFLDGGSFITHNGEKNDLYYTMREILAENQAFASTILSFDYQTSATYIAGGTAYSTTNAVSASKGDFAKINSVNVNMESALVTQLYSKHTNEYMYMLQNITDTRYSALQTLKVTFNENYQYAIVWKNGEKGVVRLENNEYVVKLDAGEAVYVIPFNPDESNGEDGFYDAASGDNGGWWPGSTSGTSKYDMTMIATVHEQETGDNGAWYPGSISGKSPW